MAEIRLDSLTKTYPDGFAAVKGISLNVPDGALCVLVGPSGCGKSTTLRMVAGLEDVTGGTIAIGGRAVNDVHPADRDIAMVFQNYALYPNMTVYANMAFPLKMRKVPKAEIDKRVRGAAETLGLTSMLERRPAALSGGQRQRVAVGRAIVREPKAFLFDEPLSNLDAKLRVSTRAEIKALQTRLKTTTIYVTHDQEEAMSLADVMVVMAGGLIQQSGAPMDLYLKPKNRFVATFVGLPPMNILEGTLESRSGGVTFIHAGTDATGQRCEVALDRGHAAGVGAWIGKTVGLGLRPQAFRVAGPGEPAWRFGVHGLEAMGDHSDAFFGTSAQPHVVARLPGSARVARGDTVSLAINAAALHVFEPGEFGRNLTLAV